MVAHAEFAFSPQWEPTTVAFDVALDDCVDGTLSLVVVNGDGATSRAYRVDLPSLFDRPHAQLEDASGASATPDDPHGVWPQDTAEDFSGHGTTAAWPEAEAQLPS